VLIPVKASLYVTVQPQLFYNSAAISTCRLKSREGNLGFGVEVLKHERTNMAAVLLYHNSRDLVSAAYSIDADQLPDPSQVQCQKILYNLELHFILQRTTLEPMQQSLCVVLYGHVISLIT